jgi:AraC-like DNA-binding protein
MSATEPSVSTLRSEGRLLILSVPRDAILPRVVDAVSRLIRPTPRGNEALRLLLGYLRGLSEMSAIREAEMQRPVVAQVHDLLVSALGVTPDAMVTAQGGGIRAARRGSPRFATMRWPTLRRPAVGEDDQPPQRRQRPLCPSAVRRDRTKLGRFVEEERLKRAFALLTHPTRAVRKIGEIASTVGFQEPSMFSRAFRRRFGD